MASEGAFRWLLPSLHYAAPFIVLGCFLPSTLWSVLMLQTQKNAVRPKLRTTIGVLLGIGILTYVSILHPKLIIGSYH
jgi:hypothetical protein